jgi:hypothetical protein
MIVFSARWLARLGTKIHARLHKKRLLVSRDTELGKKSESKDVNIVKPSAWRS